MNEVLTFDRPKIITRFSLSRRLGYCLDLDDAPCSVTVTPNSGDVLLHEGQGEDRVEYGIIPGTSVIGFVFERRRGGDRVVLRFRHVDGSEESHVIGSPEDIDSAEAWVQRVNSLYRGTGVERELSQGRLQARHAESPVIGDIVADHEVRVVPGRYIVSKQHESEYRADWLRAYVEECVHRVVARTSCKPPNVIWHPQPSHAYPWLIDHIDYGEDNYQERITLPLEIIFYKGIERTRRIGIVPLGFVSEFAIVYSGHAKFANKLHSRHDVPLTNTFEDFTRLLSNISAEHRPTICTLGSTAVDFLISDAIYRRQIDDDKRVPTFSIPAMAHWLDRFFDSGIVACDIGIAYELLHHLASGYYPGHGYQSSRVPYDSAIEVGFAYKKADRVWGAICAESLYAVVNSRDKTIMASLEHGRNLMKSVGIRVAA